MTGIPQCAGRQETRNSFHENEMGQKTVYRIFLKYVTEFSLSEITVILNSAIIHRVKFIKQIWAQLNLVFLRKPQWHYS